MARNTQRKLEFQGFIVPPIVYHGTTEAFANASIQDGVYRPQFPNKIWTKNGDVRAWPKDLAYQGLPKATIIIDTYEAYEGLVRVVTGGIFCFNYLPTDSYEIFLQKDWPAKEYFNTCEKIGRKLVNR
jgi:hypothetical protein